DRLIGRRREGRDAEMAIFSDQASTLQTTEELGRAADRLLSTLDRRLAALVVIDPAGHPRVAFSAWGSVPAPSVSSPLLAALTEAGDLISAERARAVGFVEIERACLRWGAEYLAPLVDGEILLGLIAIAPKAGGGRPDTLELETLDRMRVTLT